MPWRASRARRTQPSGRRSSARSTGPSCRRCGTSRCECGAPRGGRAESRVWGCTLRGALRPAPSPHGGAQPAGPGPRLPCWRLRGACPLSRVLPGSVPSAYGTLTVRSLLDTREHCLNEFNFPDPYSKVSAAPRVGVGVRGDAGRGVLPSGERVWWQHDPQHWRQAVARPGPAGLSPACRAALWPAGPTEGQWVRGPAATAGGECPGGSNQGPLGGLVGGERRLSW